jgi:hypothetical protein
MFYHEKGELSENSPIKGTTEGNELKFKFNVAEGENSHCKGILQRT